MTTIRRYLLENLLRVGWGEPASTAAKSSRTPRGKRKRLGPTTPRESAEPGEPSWRTLAWWWTPARFETFLAKLVIYCSFVFVTQDFKCFRNLGLKVSAEESKEGTQLVPP